MKNIVSRDSHYAAKLLFQFRFEDEPRDAYRMTEERTILLQASSANAAFHLFNKLGRSEKRTSFNDEGEKYFFEFIGITDMIHLGLECGENEVWYSMKRLKSPMERREAFVPKKEKLAAFRYEKRLKRFVPGKFNNWNRGNKGSG